MAEKCELCGEKIKETFLGKIDGTVIRIKGSGEDKKKFVCSSCQKLNVDLHKAVKNG